MQLVGKRVCILAEDKYEEIELCYPKIRLGSEGAQITIAGTGQGSYLGLHDCGVDVGANIQDLSPDDFDALVIPGGYAPDRLRMNEAVLDFTRGMSDSGKVVAAIGHGPSVLISAGLTKGRRMTSHPAIKPDIVNSGASFVDEPMVRDGNIITGSQWDDLEVFCGGIIQEVQRETQVPPELLATR